MVHWFGRSVPAKELQLHIAIANVDAFRRRYLAVIRSMPGPATELNLMGPSAGLSGLLVGLALTPTGFIAIAKHAREISDVLVGRKYGGVLSLVYRILGWALGPALLIGLGLPISTAGVFAAVLGGDDASRHAYEMFGEVAMLIAVVVSFWDLITGPRALVKNPLLRRLLDTLDVLAGLFAQVIGFAAMLITRIAPVLPHVVGEFRALGALVDTVMSTLSELMDGLKDALQAPFKSPSSPIAVIKRAFAQIMALPATLMESVGPLLEQSSKDITSTYGAIRSALAGYDGKVRENFAKAFAVTALGMLLENVKRIMSLMPAVGKAFSDAAKAPKPKPPLIPIDAGDALLDAGLYALTGGFTGSLNDLLDSFDTVKFPAFVVSAIPDFPSTPTIEGIDDIMKRIGKPAALDETALTQRVEQEAKAALKARHVPDALLRDPRSGLAGDRRELLRTEGTPTLLLTDEQLRDAIYLAVGRILPPELRVHAPDVRALFDEFDAEVYGITPTAETLPMLEIEDNGRLRPVVGMLSLRAKGGFEPDVRAFRDLLLQEIHARTYAVVAE